MPSAVASGALGAAAPGQAQGVMPPQVLGGPVWWFFFGVYLLAIALSIFCVLDSLRPQRRERFAELPEPGWLYSAVHGLYVACVVAAWIPAMPRLFAVVPVIATPVALALGVAYLLRVVFPAPGGDTAHGTPTDSDA